MALRPACSARAHREATKHVAVGVTDDERRFACRRLNHDRTDAGASVSGGVWMNDASVATVASVAGKAQHTVHSDGRDCSGRKSGSARHWLPIRNNIFKCQLHLGTRSSGEKHHRCQELALATTGNGCTAGRSQPQNPNPTSTPQPPTPPPHYK